MLMRVNTRIDIYDHKARQNKILCSDEKRIQNTLLESDITN